MLFLGISLRAENFRRFPRIRIFKILHIFEQSYENFFRTVGIEDIGVMQKEHGKIFIMGNQTIESEYGSSSIGVIEHMTYFHFSCKPSIGHKSFSWTWFGFNKFVEILEHFLKCIF